MERFYKFLDSLHTPDNEDVMFTILEGLWTIYNNDPYSQDMGGELLTEETEKNPKDIEGFNERANAKHHELVQHRKAELKKATPKLRLFAKV